MKWRESNGDKTLQQMRDHFARPENGSLYFSQSTWYRRLEAWKELKQNCADVDETKARFGIGQGRVLTDDEWVEVFEFMDRHPNYGKEKVVSHFNEERGLKFSRRTLQVWFLKRECVERRVNDAKKMGSGSRSYKQRIGGR